MRGVRRGGGLLAAGTILATGQAALAQAPEPARLPPGAIVQPLDDGPGAQHRRNLTTVANNPRSVSALVGAGRSALALGDGAAAFSFFARADEIEPRNARVKAGMASALVLLERGPQALAMFREADALGAPDAEIARDRGLAYDMTGDPRRAQQDYALVLRRGDDPEVRRRLALSLAISGQRDAALEAIAGQLRAQDRAAWRTQAFVLALTGDSAGASRTAARMMPAGAQSMAPFFARLAALSPSQKALAVHFGSFPSDGRAAAGSQVDTSPDPGAMQLAQGGRIPQLPVATRPREAFPDADPVVRRRPGRPTTTSTGAGASAVRVPRERDLGRRADRDPDLAGPIAPAVRRQEPARETRRFEPPRPDPEPIRGPEPEPAPASEIEVQETQLADGSTLVSPGFSLAPGGEQPRIDFALPEQTQPEPATEAAADLQPSDPLPAPIPAQPVASAGLGDLNSVLAGIDDADAPPVPAPTRPAARTPARIAEPRPALPTRTAGRRPAQPAHPSRRWVQIATVPDRAALAREFARLRTRAPEALRNRGAYGTSFGRSSSRLLVGPFDNARAAQEVITQLGRASVSAFAWTSEAGQEIDRVQTANDSRSTRSRTEPAQRPAARGARGRSQPEQRPASRRGRSGR